MFYALLTLFSALSISTVAAYFSIIGLATIFPGSMAAVITMGTALEIGKIVAAIWLHRNWKRAPFLIKSYLIFGVLILMGITSMGIFGFLSKSHIEHAQQAEKAIALVEQVDNKIEREQQYIERQNSLIEQTEQSSDKLSDKSEGFIKLEQQKIEQINQDLERDIKLDMKQLSTTTDRLKQLDKQLSDAKTKDYGLFTDKKKLIQQLVDEQSLEREELVEKKRVTESRVDEYRKIASDNINTIRVRIEQYQATSFNQPEDVTTRIATLNKNINDSFDRIDELKTKRFDLNDGSKQLEAEVGPIKYVAEAIYGETGQDVIDKAVRLIIILLIFVFDPLAILLVIAANMSLRERNGELITFTTFDDTVTETAEDIIPENTEEELAEQLEAVERVMEEDREILAKLANGDSLNPADRQRIKNLDWLIDKNRK